MAVMVGLGVAVLGCDALAPPVDDAEPPSRSVAPPSVQPELLSPQAAAPHCRAESSFTKIAPNRFEVWPATCLEVGCRADGPRIVPAYRNKRPLGFRIFSIRAGSLYDQAGFKNGDIVVAANGMPFNTPDQALEAYSRLKDADEVRVDVERAGRRMTLTYEIQRDGGG